MAIRSRSIVTAGVGARPPYRFGGFRRASAGPRVRPRFGARFGSRIRPRFRPRVRPRIRLRSEPRFGLRSEPRFGPRFEPRFGPRFGPRFRRRAFPAPFPLGFAPDAEPADIFPRRLIFRRRPPAWLFRLLEPYLTGAQPLPPEAVAPPPGEPVAPPPPEDAAPPPDILGSAAAPPEAGPGGGPEAAPAPGGEPASGELPAEIRVGRQSVPIRWASAACRIGGAVPRGGGVYIVMRDGMPEAAHLTHDFASDLARRYAGEAGGEAESDGEGEGGSRRRRRRSRGGGRRSVMFGRPGRGRWRRSQFLRSLRTRIGLPFSVDDEPEPEPPED